MKKSMLMLAAVLVLAACEKKAEETPATVDSAPAAVTTPAPADTAAMATDSAAGDSAAPADSMARDTAKQM